MNRVYALLLSVLIFGLLSYKLMQPFWGHHEFNGVFYGQIARNYQRYGLINSRGAQITNPYPVDPENWSLHTHHPATYPVLLSLAFDLFGDWEYVARLLSIMASAVGMVFLAKLSQDLFSSPFAWLGSVTVIFTPLFVYYGSMPVFEPLLFPVVVLALYSFWEDRENPRPLKIFLLCLLAVVIDWPGIWLPIWLGIFEYFSRKRKKIIFSLALSLVVPLALIIGHQLIVAGSVSDLVKVGKFRLSAVAQPYTVISWIRLLISRSRAFIGLPLLFASFLGVCLQIVKKGKDRMKFVLAVLGLGVSHILVFRNIFWYHDYMLYHLLPFLGISIAGLFDNLFKRYESYAAGIILFSLIVASTILLRKPFLKALIELEPHKDCVAMGLSLKSDKKQEPFRLNREKAKECPPFIGYYGERPFEIVVEN